MYRCYLAFYAAIALVTSRILIFREERRDYGDSRRLNSNLLRAFFEIELSTTRIARLGGPACSLECKKISIRIEKKANESVSRQLPRCGIARSYSRRVADESDIVNTFLVSRRAPRNLLIHDVTVARGRPLTVFREPLWCNLLQVHRKSRPKAQTRRVPSMGSLPFDLYRRFTGRLLQLRAASITGKPRPVNRAWVFVLFWLQVTPHSREREKARERLPIQFTNFILRPRL